MKRFDFSNGASISIDYKYDGTNSRVKFSIPLERDGAVIAQDLLHDLRDIGFVADQVIRGDDAVVTVHSRNRDTTLDIIESMTYVLQRKEGFYVAALEKAKEVLFASLGNKTFSEFTSDATISRPLREGLKKDYGHDGEVLYYRILRTNSPEACRTLLYDAARGKGVCDTRYGLLEAQPYIEAFLASVRRFEEEDKKNSLPSEEEQFRKFNSNQLEILRDKLLDQNLAPTFVNAFYDSLRQCTSSSEVLGRIMNMVETDPKSYAGISEAASNYKTAIRMFKPQQPEAARYRY